MRENDLTSMKDLLAQMSTDKLDAMLNAELEKEIPDAAAVRLILAVLREREKDYPLEITPGMERAWERYQEKTAKIREKIQRSRKIRRFALRSAGLAAMLLLVLFVVTVTLPQSAQAEDFWQKIARWTDSIFSFASPGEELSEETYVFETDNPGLQQVYDAVVEMGVTEPVVPMWLPKGYELVQCDIELMPHMDYVHARFVGEDNSLVYKLSIYHTSVPQSYYKDMTQVDSYERNGINYNILRNKEKWVAVGQKDNMELSLAVDCQEDVLNKILESIYRWRTNK